MFGLFQEIGRLLTESRRRWWLLGRGMDVETRRKGWWWGVRISGIERGRGVRRRYRALMSVEENRRVETSGGHFGYSMNPKIVVKPSSFPLRPHNSAFIRTVDILLRLSAHLLIHPWNGWPDVHLVYMLIGGSNVCLCRSFRLAIMLRLASMTFWGSKGIGDGDRGS
jgi:hypothetical protein